MLDGRRTAPGVEGSDGARGQRGPIAIVANRGPNDFVWADGAWVTRSASGGLVSMLTPLAQQPDVAWYCCVSEPPDARQARRGLYTTAADQTDPLLHVVPVPVPASIYHAYYGQISNEVLWMLQHHLIGPNGLAFIDRDRHRAWDSYLEANHRLARALAAARPAPQTFLVQDYHLYPLPALLRARFPDAAILHFTHIPFPGPSLLRLLPAAWRETILRGLLGADVAGLQTRQDAGTFLDACSELLGCSVDLERRTVLTPDGRTVAVRAYPASVDPLALRRAVRSPELADARERLAGHLGELNVVRVDRLDPSKNQILGFLAFARLLAERPDLRPRIRFLAFMVPSRTDLRVYRTYREALYRTVREINAEFSADCGGPPITIFYTNDQAQAFAAMEQCDVLLVNSIKDGMNLVAKEWAVLSRRPGVMVLSETAGVACEARDSSLCISPLDVEGTADALIRAVEMPTAERAARLARLNDHVTGWTAWDWLSAQLEDLGLAEASDPPTLRALRRTATRFT